MSSRGSVADSIFVIVICFAMAFGAVIGLTIFNSFSNEALKMPAFNTSIGQNVSAKVTSGFSALDYAFPLLFIGANIAAVFLSFMIRAHPIFLIFALLMLAFAIVLAAVFSNTYYELASSAALQNASNSLTLTGFVMNNLVLLQMIFAFIDMIVLYSGFGSQGQQGGYA